MPDITDILRLAHDLAGASALHSVALVGDMDDKVLAAKSKQYTDAEKALRLALEARAEAMERAEARKIFLAGFQAGMDADWGAMTDAEEFDYWWANEHPPVEPVEEPSACGTPGHPTWAHNCAVFEHTHKRYAEEG